MLPIAAAPFSEILPHIRFPQRKALSARILFARVVGPQTLSFLEQGGSAEVEYRNFYSAFTAALDRATDPNAGSPATEHLDVFLAKLFDDIRGRLAAEFSGPYGATLKAWLDSMVEQARPVSCERCSGSRGHVCGTNRIVDNQLASYPGLCVEPLRQMFAEAWAVATGIFERHSTLLKRTAGIRVGFSTELAANPPHSFSCTEYAITGRTYFKEDLTVVVLAPLVTAFDLSTYRAVPYVLFHECICHIHQSLYPPNQTRAWEEDGYLDGWMDWVALELLTKRYPAYSDNAVAATVFHAARTHFDYREPRLGAHRALGVKAAKKLRIDVRGVIIKLVRGAQRIRRD